MSDGRRFDLYTSLVLEVLVLRRQSRVGLRVWVLLRSEDRQSRWRLMLSLWKGSREYGLVLLLEVNL